MPHAVWSAGRQCLVLVSIGLVTGATIVGVWAWCTPRQTEPGLPMAVRGRLTFIGTPGATKTDLLEALPGLLRQLGAAPVSGVLWGGDAPPVTSSTPDKPPAPAELQPLRSRDVDSDACNWVRGGDLAARVWAARGGGPCFLVIAVGPPGHTKSVVRRLLPEFRLAESMLVIYGGGRGLLVLVNGDLSREAQVGAEWSSYVYVAQRPGWQPRLIVDSKRLRVGTLELLGQTHDASSVYLGHRQTGTDQTWARASVLDLWRVDTATGSVARICRTAPVPSGPLVLVPSPDGALLATAAYVPMFLSPRREVPLYVIDCRRGTSDAMTRHRHQGGYNDCALAWSAKVPGRLFFLDVEGRVWQLDTGLARPPSA